MASTAAHTSWLGKTAVVIGDGPAGLCACLALLKQKVEKIYLIGEHDFDAKTPVADELKYNRDQAIRVSYYSFSMIAPAFLGIKAPSIESFEEVNAAFVALKGKPSVKEYIHFIPGLGAEGIDLVNFKIKHFEQCLQMYLKKMAGERLVPIIQKRKALPTGSKDLGALQAIEPSGRIHLKVAGAPSISILPDVIIPADGAHSFTSGVLALINRAAIPAYQFEVCEPISDKASNLPPYVTASFQLLPKDISDAHTTIAHLNSLPESEFDNPLAEADVSDCHRLGWPRLFKPPLARLFITDKTLYIGASIPPRYQSIHSVQLKQRLLDMWCRLLASKYLGHDIGDRLSHKKTSKEHLHLKPFSVPLTGGLKPRKGPGEHFPKLTTRLGDTIVIPMGDCVEQLSTHFMTGTGLEFILLMAYKLSIAPSEQKYNFSVCSHRAEKRRRTKAFVEHRISP